MNDMNLRRVKTRRIPSRIKSSDIYVQVPYIDKKCGEVIDYLPHSASNQMRAKETHAE
jgi:hypothetical protein